jgi:uncharacterized membrane protein YqiK
MSNTIALIVAAIIVAVGLVFSNGVYLIATSSPALVVVTNKFTGSTCYFVAGGWHCN